MGKPGPIPAPTPLKVIKGDRPSRVNHAEPRPEMKGCPTPPAWLDTHAASLWRRLAPDLHRKGILTWWDRDAFAILMNAYSVHRDAAVRVSEDGVMIGRVKHPALQISRDAASIIRNFAPYFGLTPSSRQNFTFDEADEDETRRILS